jgi:hypothetical protein
MEEIKFGWNIQHANKYPYVDKHIIGNEKCHMNFWNKHPKSQITTEAWHKYCSEKQDASIGQQSWACFFSLTLWRCIMDENK